MKRFSIVIVAVGLFVVAAISQEEQKGPVTPKEKIVLWNGNDFAGWKLFVPDPAHDDLLVSAALLMTLDAHVGGESAGFHVVRPTR